MIDYTAYDLTTGRITRYGSCSGSIADIVLLTNEGKLATKYADDVYYINVTTQAPVAIPAKPGEYYTFNFTTKAWVAPSTTLLANNAIAKRNGLLRACDWTQLVDSPLATQTLWLTYRNDLRAIESQPGYPTTITWPVPPA